MYNHKDFNMSDFYDKSKEKKDLLRDIKVDSQNSIKITKSSRALKIT